MNKIDGMSQYTVFFCEDDDPAWRFFLCHADNANHAEEQCENAYPDCKVIWVNEGEDYEMH